KDVEPTDLEGAAAWHIDPDRRPAGLRTTESRLGIQVQRSSRGSSSGCQTPRSSSPRLRIWKPLAGQKRSWNGSAVLGSAGSSSLGSANSLRIQAAAGRRCCGQARLPKKSRLPPRLSVNRISSVRSLQKLDVMYSKPIRPFWLQSLKEHWRSSKACGHWLPALLITPRIIHWLIRRWRAFKFSKSCRLVRDGFASG